MAKDKPEQIVDRPEPVAAPVAALAVGDSNTRKPDDVIDGAWIANCEAYKGLHVAADSQEEAVGLVCQYIGCEPHGVVVVRAKRKSGPRRGDMVLRKFPVAGGDGAMGYIYGVKS